MLRSHGKPKRRLYFAGPLFSHSERWFNKWVSERLRVYFDVYLPQEDGILLFDAVNKGMDPKEAATRIFRIDCDELRTCDVLLMVMDGRTIDEGTAFELGMAYSLGKECIGLQTDPRRLTPFGNSPMIEGALSRVFESPDELLIWVASESAAGFSAEKGLDECWSLHETTILK